MWARVVEVLLACWLAMSPFIFGHPPGARALWVTDLAGAALTAAAALLSFHPRLRRAHLAGLAVGAWLAASGWAAVDPESPSPARQNHVCAGLILMMLAVVPSGADRPPDAWLEFYGRRGGRREPVRGSSRG